MHIKLLSAYLSIITNIVTQADQTSLELFGLQSPVTLLVKVIE